MTQNVTSRSRRVLYVVGEDKAFLLGRLPMARAAKTAGFEVHVATSNSGLASIIEAEGFIVHNVPFRRGSLSLFTAVQTVLALRRVEDKIEPNVIHHVGLQSCFYGSLATAGRNFPQVNGITGLGYIFTSANFKPRLLRAVVGLILPTLLNRRFSVVLVENPDDRTVLANLGVNEKNLVVISGSGVDTDRFQPLPEPEAPITFGFVGRLLKDKGIRALVSAHQILKDRGYDFRLLIIGKPDPANPSSVSDDEVKEWSKRRGISCLGHIKDITELWERCHFAVLPSHREGLPISLLEAAACGRAMIATDAPGCREIVIQDKTGLLVPIDNPEALADAILRLANSPTLRAKYACAARKLVVERLSAKIVGAAAVDLYNKLLLAS